MKTDTVIKCEGMDALFDKLGIVDAERFITLMSKENFDYTNWHKDMYADLAVDELGKKAYDYCREEEKKETKNMLK